MINAENCCFIKNYNAKNSVFFVLNEKWCGLNFKNAFWAHFHKNKIMGYREIDVWKNVEHAFKNMLFERI